MPWAITAHFRNFPVKSLIRCKDMETVKQQFLNNLKEVPHCHNNQTLLSR
jgi:hypothetical protein